MDERLNNGLSSLTEMRQEFTAFISETRKYRAAHEAAHNKVEKRRKQPWSDRALGASGGGGAAAVAWLIMEKFLT